jgi:hypothetical protein
MPSFSRFELGREALIFNQSFATEGRVKNPQLFRFLALVFNDPYASKIGFEKGKAFAFVPRSFVLSLLSER